VFCVLANYHSAPYRELVVATSHVNKGQDEIISSRYLQEQSPSPTNPALSHVDGKLTRASSSGDNEALFGLYSPLSFMHSHHYLTNLFELRKSSAFHKHMDEQTDVTALITLTHHKLSQFSFSSSSFPCDNHVNNLVQALSHLSNRIQSDGKYRVHSFIILSRCPCLNKLFHLQQTSSYASHEVDLTNVVSSEDWILFPIILDYLYVSYKTLTMPTLRLFSLLLYVLSSDCDENGKMFMLSHLFRQICPSSSTGAVTPSIDSFLFDICFTEKAIWRQYSPLAHSLTSLLIRLYSLGLSLSLDDCFLSKCESLLLSTLCPLNAIVIAEWAFERNRSVAVECCLKYFSLHLDVIVFPTNNNRSLRTLLLTEDGEGSMEESSFSQRIIASVKEMIAKSPLLVITKKELYTKKLESLTRIQLRSDYRPLIQYSLERLKEIATLTSGEEMPSLISTSAPALDNPLSPASASTSSYIALSKVVGHCTAVYQNQSLLFFGGMNRERFYTLSRLLCYDVLEDRFRYVIADSSKAPVTANLNWTFNLRKNNSNTFIMIGGKVKKEKMKRKNDSALSSFIEEGNKSYMTNLSTIWTALSEQLDAERKYLHVQLKSKKVKRIKHRPVKHEHKEESDDDLAESSDNDDNSEESNDRIARNNQSYHDTESELMESDYIFEFHYPTLTWNRKAIFYNDQLSHTLNRRNPTIFTPHFDPNMSSRELLSNSFKRRIAQSVIPIYSCDIPYRCPRCLFHLRTYAIDCDCIINEQKAEQQRKEEEFTWAIQFGGYCQVEEEIKGDLYMLFCRKIRNSDALDALKSSGGNDQSSNIVASTPAPEEYQYEWMKLTIHSIGNEHRSVRFGHQGVFIPPKVCPSHSSEITSSSHMDSIHHARIFYFGGASYHDFPDNLVSLRINSKEVKEHYHIDEDLSWEAVIVGGGDVPANRHDHSFTYIAEGNFCLLFGGMSTDVSTHQNVVLNDLWTLHWYFSSPPVTSSSSNRRSSAFQLSQLCVQWNRIEYDGIPPSIRSRHSASYIRQSPVLSVSNDGYSDYHGCLIVFGGLDDTYRDENDPHLPNELLFDEKQRDSIIHMLKWKLEETTDGVNHYRNNVSDFVWITKSLISTSSPSSYLNIDCCPEDYFPVAADHLSSDLSSLLFIEHPELSSSITSLAANDELQVVVQDVFQKKNETPFLPDVTFFIDDDNMIIPNLDELSLDSAIITSPNRVRRPLLILRSFTSLLSQRCHVIYKMLTSEMIEGQTKQIHLSSVDTNMNSFQLFLYYLLSDMLSFQHDVAPSLPSVNLMEVTSPHNLDYFVQNLGENRNILQEIIGLIEISKFYSMNSLMKRCEGLLLSLITESTVIEILQYADMMNLDLLQMVCYQFIFRNIGTSPSPSSKSTFSLESTEMQVDSNGGNGIESSVSNKTNNLALILTDEICNTEFLKKEEDEVDKMEVKEDVEVVTSSILVDSFKHASVEVKQKFRDFAVNSIHVYLYDVWEALKHQQASF
jgi:hypothetical protein